MVSAPTPEGDLCGALPLLPGTRFDPLDSSSTRGNHLYITISAIPSGRANPRGIRIMTSPGSRNASLDPVPGRTNPVVHVPARASRMRHRPGRPVPTGLDRELHSIRRLALLARARRVVLFYGKAESEVRLPAPLVVRRRRRSGTLELAHRSCASSATVFPRARVHRVLEGFARDKLTTILSCLRDLCGHHRAAAHRLRCDDARQRSVKRRTSRHGASAFPPPRPPSLPPPQLQAKDSLRVVATPENEQALGVVTALGVSTEPPEDERVDLCRVTRGGVIRYHQYNVVGQSQR